MCYCYVYVLFSHNLLTNFYYLIVLVSGQTSKELNLLVELLI